MDENTEYRPFALLEQYNPDEGATEYYNTLRTLTVAKNDCSNGTVGSSVTLTADANHFVSTESVADANMQADSWLSANGQAYANNIGTCELDSTPPSTPSLSYSLVTPTTLTLSWTSSTDNIGITGYDIYKDGVLLDSTSSNILNYSVTGLSGNTAYGFYVKAKDAAGNSSNSNTINVTILPSLLTLAAATSVIFEKQASSWADCKFAASADFQYTSDNVLGAGTNGTTFYLNRYRGIIDTSSVTSRPQSAKIKFKFSANTVGSSLTFNLFASNTKIPVSQTLQLTDWNDWNEASFIGNVTVPSNSTSYNEIPLTSAQLDLLDSEQAYNFFLISNGDRSDLAPTTNSRPVLSIEEVYLECHF